MSHRSLLKNIFFSLKAELQRGRKRERHGGILHQFVHSPDDFNGPGLGQTKSRSRDRTPSGSFMNG